MINFGLVVWLASALVALSARQVEGQYDNRASIESVGPTNLLANPKVFGKGYNKTPMHKAILTQKGYIQFLRWELPVPEIEEFTYCMWVKSLDLTHSHSIFSYSMNETRRLVRSWISPLGRSVHLEIGGIEIMGYPTRLEEHRWYHICQSWDNQLGHYALWIDGRKEIEGYATRLVGHVIPKGGDIVVGQEYTDFDKGLEEGIEGAVLGFNLLLVSAFERSKYLFPLGERVIPEFGRLEALPEPLGPHGVQLHRGIPLRRIGEAVNAYPVKIASGKGESTFESTLREYLGDQELFGRNLQRRSDDRRRVVSLNIVHKNRRDLNSRVESSRRTKRNAERNRRRVGQATLGLQLVSLTYARCEIGRGSPFIGGSKMLISWTRTPVKVFGGAILKDAKSSCGHF